MKSALLIAGSLVIGLVIGVGSAWTGLSHEDRKPPIAPPLPSGVVIAADGTSLVPVAYVAEPNFNFGTMVQGETDSHEFFIENRGDAPLKLGKPTTSCKCTVGKLENDTIPPGGKVSVTLEWKARSMIGNYSQRAIIPTNDPKHGQIVLNVTGTLSQVVTANPSDVVFSTIGPKESASAQVKLLSETFGFLKVKQHSFEDPSTAKFFEVKYRKLTKEEATADSALSGVLVTIKTKPGLPLGPFQQRILLKTTIPHAPEMPIPVHGKVASDISMIGKDWVEEAALLRIGFLPQGDGAVRKLTLMVRGPHRDTVAVTGVEAKPDVMKVDVGQPKRTATVVQFPVTVEIPKNCRPINCMGSQQGARGEIVFRTSHPDIEQMRIFVEFAVEGTD